jgi:hypothetical protein
MGFLSRICTFCAVSGVVSNVWGGRNGDELHKLRYFFSNASAAFWLRRRLMFGYTIRLLLFQHGNRLILEHVLVGFYSSTQISLFQSKFFFFFFPFRRSLIQIYQPTGDSLRSMPANVIIFSLCFWFI